MESKKNTQTRTLDCTVANKKLLYFNFHPEEIEQKETKIMKRYENAKRAGKKESGQAQEESVQKPCSCVFGHVRENRLGCHTIQFCSHTRKHGA